MTTSSLLSDFSPETGILTITINRPEAFNSLNGETRSLLLEELKAIRASTGAGVSADKRVRAVVLTGAGKAFCTGQDLKELATAKDYQQMADIVDEYTPLMDALLDVAVPVIAAIPGPAAGAGWGIAMACDFRVISENAFFKPAFSSVGLAADCGLSFTLAQSIGRAQATEILMLDQMVPAAKAQELGIVNVVAPVEEFHLAVEQFALRLAAGPTVAYEEIKTLMNSEQVKAVVREEGDAQKRLGKTKDVQAGVQAFVKSEKPQFTGE